jgi:peptide/nickel transport system permease protein
MHATTATCLLGGSGNGPSKVLAYSALLAKYSSVTVTPISFDIARCRLLHRQFGWLILAIGDRYFTGPDQLDQNGAGRPKQPAVLIRERSGVRSLPCAHATLAKQADMIRFLARRLLNYVVLLALASFLTFCLTSLAFHPLDSFIQRHPQPPAEAIHAKAVQLGLDKPIPIRYGKWIAGVVHGDFGTTVAGHPVSEELWRRVGISLRLLVIGSVVGMVVGVMVGAWGAIRQYHMSDRVITVLSLVTLSIPSFVLAGLLILAGLRVNMVTGLQLFLYTGETSPLPHGGLLDQFIDRAQHIVLPSLTLALGAIAVFSRYQRNAMLDVLSEDFIRTARAKGLTRRRALFKHGLRTALIPLATLFAYGVSGLVVGAVFVEKIFGWHGMGEWAIQGISTQDTNIVLAIALFSGAAVLLAGLLSDVFYAVLDPRVRVS